jgi:methylated-DNA-[protein]-cysteine S-methyltransferase
MSTAFCYTDTTFGRLLLVGRAGMLSGLYVADHDRAPHPLPDWDHDPAPFATARSQLDEYFAGRRTTFDLSLHLEGTAFQVKVWSALADVPYGHTIGYAELARQIGRPSAARAVGSANGCNPISIILPCHRVIGSDGSLTGYGWGTDRKAWLLDHEHTHLNSRLAPHT